MVGQTVTNNPWVTLASFGRQGPGIMVGEEAQHRDDFRVAREPVTHTAGGKPTPPREGEKKKEKKNFTPGEIPTATRRTGIPVGSSSLQLDKIRKSNLKR